MKDKRNENKNMHDLWNDLRMQVGEERLAELYCYGAIQRIRKALASGEDTAQICHDIASILRGIGLD